MKKTLRFTAVLAAAVAFSSGAMAQKGNSTLKPVQAGKASLASRAACGPEISDYVYAKIDTLNTTNANSQYFMDLWPGEKVSTAYALTQPATITSALIYSRVAPGNVAPVSMTVSVATLDSAFRPSTILGSTNVSVTATGQFLNAVFTTPIAVSDSFAIVVTNTDTQDTIQVLHTNINYPAAGITSTWTEPISYYDWGNGWQYFPDVMGYEAEIRLIPVLTYTADASFTAPATACVGAPVNFANTSSTIYGNRFFNMHAFDATWIGEIDSTFRWNFGDAAGTTYANSTSHTYNTAGTYTVTLIGVIDGAAAICADTTTMVINVIDAPNPTVAAAGATTFCEGGDVALDASPADAGNTYQWMLNGNAIGGSTFAQHIANESGDYQVMVSNMCGSNTSAPITVTEIMNPVAAAAPAGSATSCDGSMVTLDATPVSGADYQWLMDGMAIGGSTFAQHMANESGNYAVVVSNTCGADTSSGIDVLVLTPADISASSTTVCQGEQAVLTAWPDNNSTYQWYMDDIVMATETNPTYTAVLSGEFKVEVNNACGTTMDSVMVMVNPTPETPMIMQDSTSYLVIDTATVDSSSMVQWFYNGTAISGANFWSHFPADTGYYHVMVTDTNGCTVTSDSVNVMTVGVKEIVASNIFVSPNPTEGVFTVNYSSTATGTVTVTLVNVRGQVIMSEQIGQFSGKVTRTYDISGNDAGVYFLHVANEKGATVHKVVVSK